MAKQVIDWPLDARPEAGVPHLAQIVLGNDGFSWRLADRAGQTLAARGWVFDGGPYASLQAALPEWRPLLASQKMLGQPITIARCAFANGWATLVPRRLFDAQQLGIYFTLLLPAGEYDYGYAALPMFDCYVVYAVEPEVKRLIALYLPEVEVGHTATGLIQGFQEAMQAGGYDTAMGVQVRDQSVQLVGLERGQLLFYNHFPIEHADDVLYYTLLAYEQCRLRPTEVPLLLSGAVKAGTSVHTVLARGMRHLAYVPSDARLGVDVFDLRWV